MGESDLQSSESLAAGMARTIATMVAIAF